MGIHKLVVPTHTTWQPMLETIVNVILSIIYLVHLAMLTMVVAPPALPACRIQEYECGSLSTDLQSSGLTCCNLADVSQRIGNGSPFCLVVDMNLCLWSKLQKTYSTPFIHGFLKTSEEELSWF